jgi:uncharacterized protein YbaP (TraB family)
MLILVLLVSLTGVYSQVKENSLLWKISGNGLEKSSYLFGTIHLLCPDDLVIKDKLKNAFEETEQLVMELDFNDAAVMPIIQQNMRFSDGTTAKDYLNEKEYRLLKNFFRDSLGMPFERMNSIKPFYLSSITLVHFLGCRPASFERQLTKMATRKNMRVEGLETAKEQVAFIDNLSIETQKKMLLENLKDYKHSKKMFDKMVGFYLNENLSGLNAISEQYMSEEYASLKEELLVKRNKNWLPGIIKFIKKNPVLIAVGASHLPGEKGLIRLLREEGYTVEPVKT